jgi:hypothetical protein
MKEEYGRLNEAERVYRRSVKKAVRGAPRIKRIGKKEYLYLESRTGGKVADRYVGPAGSEKALKVIDAVKRRRKDQESLRKIRNDLKEVKRVLRIGMFKRKRLQSGRRGRHAGRTSRWKKLSCK